MRHSRPAVRAALADLTHDGWSLRPGGHWGVLTCRFACKCRISVAGSPRDDLYHAKYLRRMARRCRRRSEHD